MGELLLKSGLKQEKLSVRPLDCAQVFTRVEGGIWILANLHRTSFIKFKFNPRVCFLRLLFTQLYGPSYVKQTLNRG
jgi:hypothetical protein